MVAREICRAAGLSHRREFIVGLDIQRLNEILIEVKWRETIVVLVECEVRL